MFMPLTQQPLTFVLVFSGGLPLERPKLPSRCIPSLTLKPRFQPSFLLVMGCFTMSIFWTASNLKQVLFTLWIRLTYLLQDYTKCIKQTAILFFGFRITRTLGGSIQVK